MKNIYFLLTIIGAIVPYIFFIPFFQAEGIALIAFTQGAFVNGAAGGITADLLFSSAIFWLFMFQQVKRSKSPKPWLFIVLNLMIGLSCALPAYLYARDRGNG